MAATASAGAQSPAPYTAHEKQEQFDVQWQSQNVDHPKPQDILNAASCSNPGPKQQRRKGKRKNDSLSTILCAAIVQHQLGMLNPPIGPDLCGLLLTHY